MLQSHSKTTHTNTTIINEIKIVRNISIRLFFDCIDACNTFSLKIVLKKKKCLHCKTRAEKYLNLIENINIL